MKKKIKQMVLGASVTGIVALLAAYHASADRLITLAMDREAPPKIEKERKRISGNADFKKIGTVLMEAAKELTDRDTERVRISGDDNTPLVGHWLCPENPKRIIIAMHGWRSSWDRDFGIITPFWYQNRCAVLYAEQRGQGESGGDHIGFGLLERHDCLRWIQWAVKRTDGQLPIYLGGVSMGASTILMASGEEFPEQVRGIIADCGFTSPGEIWAHVAKENLHLPYGLYGRLAGGICRRKLQLDINSYSCQEALKQCRTPVLFIHGSDDRFVPVRMTFENYKACTGPKRMLIVPGADHGMSYLVDKVGYENAILQFWNDFEK